MNSNQTCAVVGTLITNADMESVDFTRLQRRIKEDPQGMGRDFKRFLQAGAVMPLGDLKIATAPFVATFVGADWKVDPKEQDKRSQALTEVDFATAEMLTCLEEGEPSITGEVKLARLKGDDKRIRYGSTVFMGLWLDYKARLQDSVLEKLYQERGITRMYFFGDVLLSPRGGRCVLYLVRDGGGAWGWHSYWLDDGFDADRVAAVSPQVS